MTTSKFQTRRRSCRFLVFSSLLGACATAAAQDFALSVANNNPLGIGNFVPTRLQLLEDSGGIESGIKGAFGVVVAASSTYDSNFFLSENDAESELSLDVVPTLTYTSDPEGGAGWTFNASYQPTFRAFLDNSDLNNFDQSGNLQLGFKGARTDATIYTSYSQLSATDRLTGDFTTGSVFSSGILASRRIAARTSINGGLSYAQSEFDTPTDEGAEVWSSNFGGLWDATERISVGSSLIYTRSESGNTGSRDAWALMGEARYRVGERIWLSASLGPEFSSDSESGDNNVSLRGTFTSRYTINERWSWVNSLISSSIPSPSDTGYFVNDYAFSTSLEHQLTRATVIGGIEFNYTEYQAVGPTTDPRDNENSLSFYLTYGRSFFKDRVSGYSTIRYNTNSGLVDWSQWQLTVGLSVPF